MVRAYQAALQLQINQYVQQSSAFTTLDFSVGLSDTWGRQRVFLHVS